MIFLLACTAPSYHGQVVVRVPVDSPEAVQRLAQRGDLWSEHIVDSAIVRLDRSELPELGSYEVLIPDVQQAIYASYATGTSTGSFWDDWRDLDEIEEHLEELDTLSGEAEVVVLGTSLEGRDILGLEISRPSDEHDKLGVLVSGTQHAREWVAASTALWMAEHLVMGSGLDPEVDALLDQWKFVVVPVVNPEGYEYSWTTDRMWRKNRRDNGDGTYGVDLNRNWDLAWGGVGSSSAGSSDNYHGSAPFSEPETAALSDYLASRPRIGMYLDLHNFSQLVLHPFGFTSTLAADDPAFAAASAEAALQMGALDGSVWDAGPFYTRLYPASGVAIDWAYVEHGANAWLIELSDRGQYGFLLPADQIVGVAEEAWEGLVALTQAARPRLHLEISSMTSGQTGWAAVHRAEAGEVIEIYTSTTGPGLTVLADGTSLELDQASRLGSMSATSRGRRTLGFNVSPAPGSTLWVQARQGSVLSVPQSEVVQ
jgi:carboxypeptidase A2